MDIYIPNRKLWTPDNVMAELSPPRQNRILADMRRIRTLTPDMLMMMGAAGGVSMPDKTSYAFDGTGDYLSAGDSSAWDIFGNFNNLYTIEVWAKHTDHAGLECYVAQYEDADNFWFVGHDHGYGLAFWYRAGGVTQFFIETGGEITDTNWHHVVFVVVGNGTTFVVGIYKDGTQVNYVSKDVSDTFVGSLFIGKRSNFYDFDGRLDEVRIYAGNPFGAAPVVGKTDTITVPTAIHQSDANTKLLIHCGETIVTGTTGSGATFVDSTGVHTVTEAGNAIRDTVNYKF